MAAERKSQKFPVWYIIAERAAIGAVSERKILAPRVTMGISLDFASSISEWSKPPSGPVIIAIVLTLPFGLLV